jgi:hypothetical protein
MAPAHSAAVTHREGDKPMSSASGLIAKTARYGVILVRRDIDRFNHNDLFVDELAPAFAAAGQPTRVADYRADPAEVFAALKDPDCRFFLCFNGFGAELRCPTGIPGRLDPAFEYFPKPLFDFMHDCPAHESMAHQISANYGRRHLMMTDYGYAGLAQSLGMPYVRFVPSITFPTAFHATPQPLANREIPVLLPIGLPPPEFSRQRHLVGGSIKSRVYREIFETVSEAAVADLRRNPLNDLRTAGRELGIIFDFRRADDRFLLTTILDYVKSVRRRNLLDAISALPVTVIADRQIDELPVPSRLRFQEARSATALLKTMAQSRCVLCPTPHMTGFHERALGAFTAGSVVLSSPNAVLEACMVHGRDMAFYQTAAHAADSIAELLRQPDRAQAIADSGRKRAEEMFAPARFVDSVLSLLAIYESTAPN